MTLNEYGEDPKELGTFVSGSLDEYGYTVFGTTETPSGPAGSMMRIRIGGAWVTRAAKVRIGGVWVDRSANLLEV